MAVPTRSEAKLWCKIDSDITADDALVDDLILAAVDYFQTRSGRTLDSTTKTLKLQTWPSNRIIRLPAGPVASITSVTCRTTSGTSTVSSADYVTQLGQEETDPLIQIKDSVNLPEPDGYASAITVTYVCQTTSVPAVVKTALLTLIAHWYDNRASNSRDIGPEVGPAIDRACSLYSWGKA
jgi:uncharacterized phiE125 gp8 family phage protein